MTTDLTFKTNSIFESVSCDKGTGTLHFYFADNIYVSSAGFWRLLEDHRIVFVSFDRGKQYGQSQQLDLVDGVTKLLTGETLTDIKVHKDTADLTLTISDNLEIQVFIASSGHESYDFSIDGKRYIGLGSGEIGIVEPTDNPQVFTTRLL